MKVETFNTLDLIPIGDIKFRFDRKQYGKGTKICVADVHIMCETDRNISDETEKSLMKLMKAKGSDLLTNGHEFYTTRGNKITQIRHESFEAIKEDSRAEINKLLFN